MNAQDLKRLEYGRVKEELEQYAVSYLGKRQVSRLAPMTNGKLIRKTLDETAEAKALLQQGASVPVPSMEGMEHILGLLGTGYIFSEQDFAQILQFLTSCSQLMRYMNAKREAAPFVSAYAASMYELEKIRSAIDDSIRSGRIIDSASKELSRIRKKISVIEERRKSRLNALMSRHRSILQEHVVSTRGGRYVLPIKKEHRKQVKGTVLDESASGQTVYIEPEDLRTLQYDLSALQAEEAREEMKILSELTLLVEEHAQWIHINAETVGMYDFLFAKAKYAASMDGGNVELNEQGVVQLYEARHPFMGRSMVPLDFALGKGYSSLIVTGPNTGGKTLALKTVGLLTVMVQSGLLVPVREGSIFAVFHQIAVDIGDGQSIEHALSTFSAHIRNVIEILDAADHRTLVLIDEMASGTDPGEGVALSIAILEELHRRGASVIATTHYNEIKSFAAAASGFENARMEFDPQTLQPLYRLRIGEAGQSYAFQIALKLGIPESIIQRSRVIAQEGAAHPAAAKQAVPAIETGETANIIEQTVKAEAQAIEVIRREAGSSVPENDLSEMNGANELPTFQLGDRVTIPYLKQSGIVCEAEDSKGIVGVLIRKHKMKIHKKRLRLHIEGKELYPDDYDLDIVLDTKENRKKRKLMKRKHVEGLSIEKPEEK
ncbi:DNA mismatch repair protein MutS [Paenibacillus sp. P96]|uniref:DNA mismatch repair protein MutS n=1 Tax=Paenibacillus zeirhizosphaerae TaxID=2987519 RepID=A0ABT9FLN5_9BACL|nr:DNA mismatch repair protein MutS [Paenibacillus sp. P96]MDP4095589.1 DNA mismatch repair protein MutS [Paenibacillus sp. P96]